MTRFIPLLAFVLTGMLSLPRAEPAAGGAVFVESLEWAIADSDVAVRGTLADFDRVKDKQEVIWSTATLKVSETFKGEKKDEVKFIAAHKSRFASDRLAELGKNKGEVIVCLVKSERYKDKGADYATVPWALREPRGEVDHSLLDLGDKGKVLAVTMNAAFLTEPGKIVDSARPCVKFPDKAKEGRLRAPSGTEVVRRLSDGGPVFILVPADARFEAVGTTWLGQADLDLRVAGARALSTFKSDKNIAVLKKLLEDPQSREEGKVKRYPVRQAAYEVLKEWGVEVKMPVVEEPK